MISPGQSVTEVIEGFLEQPGSEYNAWRYVFERLDINSKHVFEEFFHGGLLTTFVELRKKLYKQHVFQAIYFEADHTFDL